jgi:hypothetical protein
MHSVLGVNDTMVYTYGCYYQKDFFNAIESESC